MTRREDSAGQVRPGPVRATGAQKLNRVWREGEINRCCGAVIDLDEVIGISCACQSSPGINLADYQTGLVIISDCAETLRVAQIRARAWVREVNEKGLIRLDQSVAVDDDAHSLA